MAHNKSTLGDYYTLRTLPALLSIFFAVASAYQFGAISPIEFQWFSYTLTAEHAALGSLVTFLVAFASSDTKRFENYEDWEMVLIVLSPAVILAEQYVTEVSDIVVNNQPLAGVVAFIVAMAGWAVAVR